MITRLRVLVVAVALAAAGTGTAAATPLEGGCRGVVTQADVAHAVVAAGDTRSLDALTTALGCAAVSKDDESDPPVCDVLKRLAGQIIIWMIKIYINSQGDVFVNDEPYYDCPPYDIEWED